ncbi:MAG TPA: MBG domain-containing protein, partial [Blastocatellia bacterium]|nr:MBG domain-containing protein [Blastocatellia bacterium]
MNKERKIYAGFLRQPAGVLTLLLIVTGLGTGALYRQTTKAPQHASSSMDAALKAAVQAARYDVSEVRAANGGQTIEAVNAAQGMRASFTAAEVQIHSDSGCQTPWQLGLKLKRYGYATQLQDIRDGVLRAQGKRVEINRDQHAITEWYLNKPEGIEQGFTLHARPAAATTDELRVVMEVSDGWQAKLEANQQAVVFQQGTASLRYDKLQTVDATGRVLASRMEVNGNELALVVDDRDATWPITIDPTLTQQTQLIGSNGVNQDHFGTAVAISGDTAVVGIPDRDLNSRTNQGAALVFVRNGSTWTQQAQLSASDGASGDVFGTSVAISGDTIIVGAYNAQIGTNTSQGAVYVFVRNGSSWSQQAKLIVSDGTANDWFGYAVALNGDTALIGAPLDDFGSTFNQGSAYVFVRSGTTWSLQRQLNANDAADNDNFAVAVALSGETAVVGTPADDVTNSNQGSAYVFVRSGTTWSQQQRLTASDAASADLFGSAVSINADTIVVGAPDDDVNANTDQGSAYVFVRNSTTWNQQAKLTASDGAANDSFGKSLTLGNDIVIIGAPNDDISGRVDQGSAYAFARSGTSWGQQQQLLASDGLAGDNLGATASISGFTTLIGAPYDDVNANTDQGSTYVFAPPCPAMTFSPTTLADGIQNVAYPSTTISSTGSVAPMTYSLSAGALPTGITLSSAGVLSGTPIASGTFNFTVKITDANLCIGTLAYSLTIAACTPPSISTQPANQSNGVGTTASFTAAANGTSPRVQWQSSVDGSNWSNVNGATSATLQLPNVTIGMNGQQFRAVFTNACGTATSNPATLTVNKLAPVVTLNTSATSVTYGQSVTLTASVNSINNIAPTGTITFSAGSTTLGTGTISNGQATLSVNSLNAAQHSISAAYGGDTNYVGATSSATSVTVNKATLTVTADNKTKTYATTNPELTASIVGWVNGDTQNVLSGSLQLSTTATSNSPAGNYPITVSGVSASNYAITFVNGTLSVSKAVLTVTAENKTKLYGAALPDLTATITGFVNGDTASVVTGAAALAT